MTATDSGTGAVSHKKIPDGVWIQFPDAAAYRTRERELLDTIADSDGNDNVVVYLKDTRGFKVLPANRRVRADETLRRRLEEKFGAENVKIRGVPIENSAKID